MKGRPRIPGEWEHHEACWLAFPYLGEEWPLNLCAAQESIAAVSRAIAGPGDEAVRLLVRNAEVERRARTLLGHTSNVELVRAAYGDCWFRDTGPSLGWDDEGVLAGLRFRFNGWGGKYDIPFDDQVGDWLLRRVGARPLLCPLVLEGGALESNGNGTILTTASCVLHENRNPGLTREAFERTLSNLVEVERVVWLERGLRHDHTDGHIDMIARFVSENTVLCMRGDEASPDADVLREVERELREAGFEVLPLPAPPAMAAPDGAPLPATYCNFYIANAAVIVPTYGVDQDDEAIDTIGAAFPGRQVVGLSAGDLLCGGGAFHCVTQPQPGSS
ncbi:MAG: agmatine deiminase family protein [Myxococcales bacterium]|nr:MAG: agmatine deiminase family protein [Myxococcales bacterium]